MDLNQHKKSALLERLDRGVTQLFVNSEIAGVDLPVSQMGKPQVILNLSYKFELDVFEIKVEGVSASISFGGVTHLCLLPWDSIYFIRLAQDEGDEGLFYFDSLPELLKERFQALVDDPQEMSEISSAEETWTALHRPLQHEEAQHKEEHIDEISFQPMTAAEHLERYGDLPDYSSIHQNNQSLDDEREANADDESVDDDVISLAAYVASKQSK